MSAKPSAIFEMLEAFEMKYATEWIESATPEPKATFEMLEAVSRREKRDRDPLGVEAISILIGIYLRRLSKEDKS